MGTYLFEVCPHLHAFAQVEGTYTITDLVELAFRLYGEDVLFI